MEFYHPDYVSKAEKSWKLIASSLQSILGCNIEIWINLVLCAPPSKCSKLRKLSFSLLSCSLRIQQKLQSRMECGSDSEYSDHISEMPIIRDKAILNCSSDCESQIPHNCYRRVEVARALRNSQGNVLSIGTSLFHRSLPDDTLKTPGYGVNSSKEEGNNFEFEVFSSPATDNQPNCFPKTLRFQKKLHSSDNSQVMCIGNQQENQLGLSIPSKKSFETYTSANVSCIFSSNNCTNNSTSEDE